MSSTTSTKRVATKVAYLSESVARQRDPFKDGDVIRWSGRFGARGATYTWVALKAGGQWFITGRSSGYARTFRQVVGLVTGEGFALKSLDIATTWTAVES